MRILAWLRRLIGRGPGPAARGRIYRFPGLCPGCGRFHDALDAARDRALSADGLCRHCARTRASARLEKALHDAGSGLGAC